MNSAQIIGLKATVEGIAESTRRISALLEILIDRQAEQHREMMKLIDMKVDKLNYK